jgi:phosphoribosylaminoimidazole-succinocarboxamide synthase
MLVQRLKPLPIEAVCRGYLIGSGWKDYQRTNSVCGVSLPAGLPLAGKLPEVIFTPATKAEQGEHDENISYSQMASIVGTDTAEKVRETTLRLYREAAEYALARGIIIADTKFEFALDDDGELILIDEALTPDSSRFWPAESWQAGHNPASFDKQILRDWLETLDWDKSPPPPTLPPEIIASTIAKYEDIRNRLLGDTA